MTTTVSAIALAAFTKVNAKITGVIKSCTLTRAATDARYDPENGTRFGGTNAINDTGGQCFQDTTTPLTDAFPDYVAGPGDALFYIRGLSQAPKEGDTLTIGGTDYSVRYVGDVAGGGGLYSVIAAG